MPSHQRWPLDWSAASLRVHSPRCCSSSSSAGQCTDAVTAEADAAVLQKLGWLKTSRHFAHEGLCLCTNFKRSTRGLLTYSHLPYQTLCAVAVACNDDAATRVANLPRHAARSQAQLAAACVAMLARRPSAVSNDGGVPLWALRLGPQLWRS